MANLLDKYGIEYGSSKPSDYASTSPKGSVANPITTEATKAPVNLLKKYGADTVDVPLGAMSTPKGVSITANPDDVKFVTDEAVSFQKQAETIARTRFTPEQIENFKGNKIGFGEAFNRFFEAEKAIPFAGVGFDVADTASLLKLNSKMEKGEELSPQEKAYILDYVDKTTEETLRGYTWQAQVGLGVAAMPAFMLEFAATAGIGKAAATAATKATGAVVKGQVLKNVAKRTAAATAGTLAQGTALAVPYGAVKYGERRLNDATAITDKGVLIAKKSTETPAKSALMAYGYTLSEVASERSGAAIGKYVVNPVTGVLKTPLTAAVNRIPADVRIKVLDAYTKLKGNSFGQSVTKLYQAGGWNGMVEELGEEQVSRILQETVTAAGADETYTFDDYLDGITPSKEQLLIEGGIISVAGGVKASATIAATLLESKGFSKEDAAEMIDNMSAIEQENFVQENIVKPRSSIVAAPIEPARQIRTNPTPDDINQFIDEKMTAWHGDDWKNEIEDRQYVKQDLVELKRLANNEGRSIASPRGDYKDELIDAVGFSPSKAAFVQDVLDGRIPENYFVGRNQAQRDTNTFYLNKEINALTQRIEKQKEEGRAKPTTIAANERKLARLNEKLRVSNKRVGTDLSGYVEAPYILEDYLNSSDTIAELAPEDKAYLSQGLERIYDRIMSGLTIDRVQPSLFADLPETVGIDKTNIKYVVNSPSFLEWFSGSVHTQNTDGSPAVYTTAAKVDKDGNINVRSLSSGFTRANKKSKNGYFVAVRNPYIVQDTDINNIDDLKEYLRQDGFDNVIRDTEQETLEAISEYHDAIIYNKEGKEIIVPLENGNVKSVSNVGTFLQDEGVLYEELYEPSTLDVEIAALENKFNTAEYGFSNVSLSENASVLSVNKIIVSENARNKGFGTSIMAEIIKRAETKGLIIALTPSTAHGASSLSRLKSFYKGIGFVENKGSNKAFETQHSMVRYPMNADLDVGDGGKPAPYNFEAEVSKSQVNAYVADNPVEIDDSESNFNKFMRDFDNELAPIQALPTIARARGKQINVEQDTKLLSTVYAGVLGMVRQQLQVGTFKRGDDGNMVYTGKSLKQTIDDFDNQLMLVEPVRKQRQRDFNDYLVARRYIEDLQTREDVEVTEEQKLKSAADMTRLASKYGDDFAFFDMYAKEVYDFQRRVLENLVWSGVMSQEKYDQILSANKNYIPFDRVVDEKSFGVISTNGVFTNANANRIIKRIKGSEAEIKDTIPRIIRNTARIIDYSMRNDVARAIASYADVIPEQVQKTKPNFVKRGTARVKVTFDERLRNKLNAAVELLGQKIERSKKPLHGNANILGSYSEMEQLVRLRIGSNDGVLTHEVGHMIDYSFGVLEKMQKDKQAMKELRELAKQRLGTNLEATIEDDMVRFKEEVQQAPKKYMDYITNDREVIANLFDLYVNSPDVAREIAPTAFAIFDKMVKSSKAMAFIQDIKPSSKRGVEYLEKDVYSPSDFAPKGTITVFENGVKQYYRVSQPILEAVNDMTPSKLSLLQKFFMIPASVLRAGATLVPEFWIRNVLRDQQTALIQSGVKYTPADFVKGIFAVVSKNDLYNAWERSGGSFNSFMELDDAGIQKAYQELLSDKGKMARYINPINVLNDVSMALEQATRIGVFAAAKRRGSSDLEGAAIARDATLNFSRRGRVGKQINKAIPFFNAGLQGISKLVRTARERPAEVMMYGIATITVPSLLITGYYLFSAPDDEREEYLEIPQWQKDLFWVVKIGGEWKRYPKPFTIGYAFGSTVERAMVAAFASDNPAAKQTYLDIGLGLASAFSPVYDASALLPPLVKVTIEDITNYNFFQGRRIYPEYMENLPAELRYTGGTSETGKVIGEALGVSPAKVDHTIRGVLASAGTYALDTGDAILKAVREWNGEEIPDEPVSSSDIPVVRAFAVRRASGYRSNSAAYFFENWSDVKEAKAALSKVKKGKAELSDAKISKYEKLVEQYGMMDDAYDSMDELRDKINLIYEDTEMDAEAKVQNINQLEDRITKIAKEANMKYIKSITAQEQNGEEE